MPPTPDDLFPATTALLPVPTPAYKHAAHLTWLVAVLNILFFSCCAGILFYMGSLTFDQLRGLLHPVESGPPPFDEDQLRQMYPVLKTMAVALTLLGLIPGLIYLPLGAAVRQGGRTAAAVAMGLGTMQAAFLGLLLLQAIIGSLWSGQISGLVLSLLILGTLLVLILSMVLALHRARRWAPADPTLAVNPWDDQA
ncbi:MAG: hypothetical protein IT443_03460 [Phycisphaeraceae bacterium]|nr:hypothetical protein [Phycisphaeraceae bacterium]